MAVSKKADGSVKQTGSVGCVQQVGLPWVPACLKEVELNVREGQRVFGKKLTMLRADAQMMILVMGQTLMELSQLLE